MFAMRLEGGAPIYEQLCARITELISNGTLAEGEKLPAVREIAKSLGINPNTVQKAYAELERRRLIYSIPAKGSYVASTSDTARIIHDKAAQLLAEQLTAAFKAGLTANEITELVKKTEESYNDRT